MELANATEFRFLKSCQEELVPCLKHVSVLSCFLALAIDLLSTVGMLPFSGGYAVHMIEFVCFGFGPRLLVTVCSWLTPAVLFVLMNVTIVSILLSSGCLRTLSKGDSNDVPVISSSEQQAHTSHEVLVAATSSTFLSRSSSVNVTRTSKVPRVQKKVKRQFSAPASMEKGRKAADEFQIPGPVAVKGTAKPTGANSSPLSAYNLITCEQDVFNEIIESYIDKFRQEMRQQEVQSMVSGQIFASSCPKW